MSLAGTTLTPTAISGDGLVVAGVTAEGDAFRWTLSTGVQNIGKLAEYGRNAWPKGLSRDGSVIVGLAERSAPSSMPRSQAFRWTTSAGFVGLGALGIEDSAAVAVSANGDHVVGRSGSQPFRWSPLFGMESLHPELQNYVATSVSDDGRTVIGEGYASPFVDPKGAFLWSVDDPLLRFGGGYLGGDANDISSDGRTMIATNWEMDFNPELPFISTGKSFLWTKEDRLNPKWITDLFPPLQLYESLGNYNPHMVATDLSANGRMILGIAGENGASLAINPDRWLISLGVPEISSGTLGLAAFGALLLATRTRCLDLTVH